MVPVGIAVFRLDCARPEDTVTAEAALDGTQVIGMSLPNCDMPAEDCERSHRALNRVE